MTFQDGITCYECLEGLSTEAADWHAKVNLYSVSEKITGSMINEYKDFHQNEITAHILAPIWKCII